ncbi:nitrite reductase large subunit NirB [Fodinicola feengrottensis]|uniref:assimilatory sulfite reductase (ferredoxin) n=1 Tax=Fodinicola feengrottensis TaxID=435914 RepID=A0ABN2HST6_9ACTN
MAPLRTSSSRRLVVVGYGMVAHRLVDALGERSDWAVTVLGEENRPAYDRVNLSGYFASGDPDSLTLPIGATGSAELLLGEVAVSVDRQAQLVVTGSGRNVPYDVLVLATGSRPFVPPIDGRDAAGAFVYRTIDDLDAIRAYAADRRVGAVVGGGLLGLEAANALRSLGLETHVVEMAGWLMPQQVDEAGGQMLRRHVESLGVRLRLSSQTASVLVDDDVRVRGLAFADGTELAADLVVFSAGVRPRDELARECGLTVGERGGVVVDDQCLTSDPNVFAVGECAQLAGRVYGLVAPGYAMAETVAAQLVGREATFPGADTSTKLKLLGVDVASFGDAFGAVEGALELVYSDPVSGRYGKLVVTDDAKRLLGGILVGDASAYPTLRALAGSDQALPAEPALLILPSGNGEAGSVELSAAAQVCSCHNVTKGDICAAIHEQAIVDVGGIKACTKAGTGCGSCVPLLKKLLGAELSKAGVEMSTALCEHFAYSRAELFALVRVRQITTFSALIAEYGNGRGCDICKPAVASILASLGNGHIHSGEQAALQDTNDHFLANLQRNGTYSVVPRLPGGEVTPDKLLAIAQVAKDFNLYTKITGGQRIDLFGARVEQLPAIWRRLVDAGMESGHAYGKALRTVKSCVGQTWCRFGVQDSTSLAVMLELRYRGLRSPHKLKAGVSGCARECAEARGKDFGIIATETGWNLYLGGNGGFTPRHAELFATDLDTDTLVTFIDRFLMFYIRTADRLQRTAPWLESLEGGMGYLREVIVDDRLGICAELDAAMQRHVGSYRDEWRSVLEDPEKLRRFTSFVNAPGTPDPSITFVTERDQIRPPQPGEAPLIGGPRLKVVS